MKWVPGGDLLSRLGTAIDLRVVQDQGVASATPERAVSWGVAGRVAEVLEDAPVRSCSALATAISSRISSRRREFWVRARLDLRRRVVLDQQAPDAVVALGGIDV